MVMASWQEVVQTAASYMENADLTMYLAHREDMRRAMKEYVAAVIKAREERDAAHTKETEARQQVIKTSNPKDLVVNLLEVTHRVTHAQAARAIDTFLKKIKETLCKHVPVSTQGPLIANVLSTAFQFQMSMWPMVGDECVRPLRVKHSDWCGLAGMVQAIVETFPNNCAIMFPQAPAPVISFSATFRSASWAPDTEKVSIDQIMLVCQCKNGVDVAYGDPDGFGCPGMMGLWDLYSSDALSWAKMQLASSWVDANFCPLCAFWSTNNETLNNHVCKHYKMGLTCRSDGFMMASMAAMKAHMELAHGYEGKHLGQVKKQKGKS